MRSRVAGRALVWLLAALLFLVGPAIGRADEPTSAPTSPWGNPNQESPLIVYGSDWWFFVHQPDGWVGRTERSASVGSNIYFLRTSETLDSYRTLIRVRILPKDFGEDVDRDLAADMTTFKQHYPRLTFLDLDVSHPGYQIYGKIYRTRSYDEYVVYMNPGKSANYYFIVWMVPPRGAQAAPDEIAAFRNVVETLTYASSQAH